ncbi:class E sortase [Yinghuangia sp. ASG 101]|uniref:class E sortase n=1 Tax=Yinghuangia sp. ASG 101 TaxID=2896848 RepID=UPI001E2F2778|nr:class E sortase [Yinghuangia sp. ASG 101]UGQ15252.1 class E sortase [Yinghuangia sp. ASG 101]
MRAAVEPYAAPPGAEPVGASYASAPPPVGRPLAPPPMLDPDFRDRTAELTVVAPPPRRARSAAAPAPSEGRAARRRALQEEQRTGRRRAAPPSGGGTRARGRGAAAELPAGAGRAARRKAARPSTRSRVITGVATGIGELAMTLGLVMVLFVVYTKWWTNVIGDRNAARKASQLQEQWNAAENGEAPLPAPDPRQPDGFAPGKGFALLYIPKLGVKVPVAQGTDKEKVLDKGLTGHYTEPKTGMPWDAQGNFAVAGHRNTHGEPFRYINKLAAGDSIVVETATTYYTYTVKDTLPETSPRNIGVINPIPKGGPFKEAGRYITLTTCTPDGASTYRLIVWGEMSEERPRTEGKPDALLK